MLSEPQPGLVITGMLAGEEPLFDEAEDLLKKDFGEVLKRSETFPFDFTHYYEHEMGAGLLRCYFAFERLTRQDELHTLKGITSRCEQNFMIEGKRRVNIDPGYVEVSRVVLASGKDSPHRIYTGKGVYAEIEYLFIKGTFSPLPWTYPDYRSEPAVTFFNSVRKVYLDKLRKTK